jgi:hypothetical protein
MSNLFDAMRGETFSTTLNGAKTLPDSGNALVDLFSAIGSSRGKDLSRVFSSAFGGDEVANVLTARILLWARDVRGGAGERQTFRSLLPLVERYDPFLAMCIAKKIPEVGRWDDLFSFQTPEVVSFCNQLIADALFANNALCAKWMPRKGADSIRIRNFMGLSPRDYRRMIVDLTKVVETQMCAKNWDKINYEHVPSIASSRYGKAFMRNDEDRYRKYLDALTKGDAKVNASAIFPYDVVRGLRVNEQLSNAQWKSLPNYLEGATDNLLCVVDTSGSMGCGINGAYDHGSLSCMDVALSLGLYVSERSRGIFQDQFITFSSRPALQQVSGSLAMRINQMRRAQWSMSTDFQAVFKLILDSAVTNNLPEKDMPTKILVFSDMEFNRCGGDRTNFQAATAMYEKAGYNRPDIVFWNLNARDGNAPVRFDENKTALVSGFSPSLMKSILSGKSVTPYSMMMETIMSDRYDLS